MIEKMLHISVGAIALLGFAGVLMVIVGVWPMIKEWVRTELRWRALDRELRRRREVLRWPLKSSDTHLH